MTSIDTQFYKKKRATSFYFSVIFLLITLVATIALYVYAGKIDQENSDLQAELSQKNQHIQNIKEKENIQIYSIYEKNIIFLERLAISSDIPSIILHLKKNFAKYGIEARGFNYSDGTVSTNISVQKNDSKQAYQKIVTFLTEYELDEKARFDIAPISAFSGHDKINYSLELSIK